MQVITPNAVTPGSFTRASVASYWNSSGVLTSAAVDNIRIGYNPIDLTAAPSAIIEPAATNVALYSEDLSDDDIWQKINITTAPAATTSPDGTNNAHSVSEQNSSSHYIKQEFVLTVGTHYVFSTYVKAGSRDRFELTLQDDGGPGTALFDLTTGTILPPQSSVNNKAADCTISSVGNGWYRCSIYKTAIFTNLNVFLRLSNGTTTNYVSNGLISLYMWGAQLEIGMIPTSYIKTTSAPATRAADIATGGLIYSNIPEPDPLWPAWNSATAYTIGQQVSINRRQYTCVIANTNRNPSTDTVTPPAWTDYGPTNRWAMFDSVVGTSTKSSTSNITVVLKTGTVNGASFMQMSADKIQVSLTDGINVLYSQTLDMTSGIVLDWYQYFTSEIKRMMNYSLTNVPNSLSGIVTIIITTGSGVVSAGNVVVGPVYKFTNVGGSNPVASSPTVGIIDYSIKTTDSFGNTSWTKRGFAKRMNVKMMLDSTSVDSAGEFLTSVRATPCVWIGANNTYQSLQVYGAYKSWEIEIAYTSKSYCSLEIEGLV